MIYILHFDRPYKHARHYTGFAETAETLQKRLDQHLAGRGSRLVQVVTDEGIGFVEIPVNVPMEAVRALAWTMVRDRKRLLALKN